jgi:hypothetical protein
MFNPLKNPIEEDKKEIDPKEDGDFEVEYNIMFMSLLRKKGKLFIRFNDGITKEVNKKQIVEMINQLSLGLMLED